MPFKSKSQLRTCYGRKRKGWDCKEWLDHTPSVCCLPEKANLPRKTRCMRQGERKVGKVQTGARGGKFFVIEEKDRRGVICVMKVYVK
jgi:hypothetical protein